MKILAVLFIFIPYFLFSQQNSFLLLTNDNFYIDSYCATTDSFCHTTFKPIVKSTIPEYKTIDNRILRAVSDSAFIAKMKHKWFWKKLLTDDLITVNKEQFHLSINPIINFEYGLDSTKRLTVNSRGIIINGDLSNKFSFTTGVIETQTFPEKYLSDYINIKNVAPGQGRVKLFKNTGFDYSYSFGHVSYSPSKHFNFQLGHGKNFVGDGYRSLLLSDVPFNYPYLRSTITYKRIQYVNLWAVFQEVKPYDNRTLVYQRKHGSFTYLNFLISPKIQLGLFEAIIFQTTDSTTNNKIPLNYFNPVIGYRTLQYGLDYKHNALIGMSNHIILFKHLVCYEQFILDDINNKNDNSKNRFGYQIGIKVLEPFKIKNLFVLTEYNAVKPYTYSSTVEHQNYSAYNEPLAHPLGANFKEFVFLVKYSYKDVFCQLKLTTSNTYQYFITLDNGTNIFNNVNEANYNNIYHDVTNFNFETGVTINQSNRLQLVGGIHLRENLQPHTTYYYISLRTSISNFYYDF